MGNDRPSAHTTSSAWSRPIYAYAPQRFYSLFVETVGVAATKAPPSCAEYRSLRLTLPLAQAWIERGTTVLDFLHTLYLFTKSDLKTILVPVTLFSTVATSSHRPLTIILTATWVWLHLLQFCVSNQSLPGSAAEDAANKPWRPLPSGRITVHAARKLRWVLLMLCLLVSIALDATVVGIALAAVFWGNNELGLDSHWALRNLFNGLGYAGFNLGATCVASGGRFVVFSSAAMPHALASLVIMTTVQAQDFQDAAGDAARGRRTLPLVFPRSSRIFTVFAIPAWSIALSAHSRLSPFLGSAFIALGACVSACFTWQKTEASDRRAYVLYNIWLSVAQVIPLLR